MKLESDYVDPRRARIWQLGCLVEVWSTAACCNDQGALVACDTASQASDSELELHFPVEVESEDSDSVRN